MLYFAAAGIGIIALVTQRPGGYLWRMLVDAPARFLNRFTWRHALTIAIALALGEVFIKLAVPQLAVVLAIDIVGLIDVLVAAVVVARLLPGWRNFVASLKARRIRADDRETREDQDSSPDRRPPLSGIARSLS
ncbi:hypothetical protein [Caulobacter sp. 1776]|uniref:hypothetical protein n=1 Tax=Caulobacter sp. 1776 TaxID=3156420 RepID=UPI0033908202